MKLEIEIEKMLNVYTNKLALHKQTFKNDECPTMHPLSGAIAEDKLIVDGLKRLIRDTTYSIVKRHMTKPPFAIAEGVPTYTEAFSQLVSMIDDKYDNYTMAGKGGVLIFLPHDAEDEVIINTSSDEIVFEYGDTSVCVGDDTYTIIKEK